MHRHDERDTVRATRWWARLAGTVAGLAGLGIAGIAAWFVAPTAGSPVPAVGELIINVLPGPLVNFGKDTLGTADKPVLLAIIVVAVLILCAIAGQLEWRRRFAGAAIFAVVAVLGMIGIAAQPDATVTAYVPGIVGLVLGYMLLSTLISKLQEWRSPEAATKGGEALSASRRNFLTWTIVAGAAAGHGNGCRPAARQRIIGCGYGAAEAEAANCSKACSGTAGGSRPPHRRPDPVRDPQR